MDNQILTEILENQKLMFNEIKDLKSNVSSLKFEQQKTNQRLDSIESNIFSLKSDVSTLKSDMSSVKLDVSTLKSDMSSVKLDVSTLKSDMSSVKLDVSTLKSDMSSVKYTLKAVFDQTANLTEFRTETNNNFKEFNNILKIHSYEIDKIKASL